MSRAGGEDWKRFEHHVSELLGLESTPASGSRFHAPGDCVDNTHPADNTFPIFAECKFTGRVSTTLRLSLLRQWAATAEATGRRWVMPIRFQPAGHKPFDVVALRLDDLAELIELARRGQE